MCVVSMVIDHATTTWPRRIPTPWPWNDPTPPQPLISPDELKEFRELLERAREYDRKNSEPECEQDDKRELLKKLAKQLGVDVSFVDGV